MFYHCLLKLVLVGLSADVQVRLRNHFFSTFQSDVLFLLYIISFLAYSLG
jgi:hypothetical protein